MTTLPIHTVKHVKSIFTRYQIIAIVFTAITLITAFLAAVSGFHLAKLRKMQMVETKATPEPVQPAPAVANDNLGKQIKSLENQLAVEKTTSQELRLKIQALENKIAASKGTPAHQTQPAPEKPNIPATAPVEKTPPPVQPAVQEKPWFQFF